MKKVLMFALAFVGLQLAAKAQFKIGFQVGYNLANLSYDYGQDLVEPEKSNYTSAFKVGLDMHWQINDYFALKPGVLFNVKGRSLDLSEQQNFQSTDYTIASVAGDFSLSDQLALTSGEADGFYRTYLGYLEIPLNAAFTYNVGVGKLMAYAGPYIAFGLGGADWVQADYKQISVNQGAQVKFTNTSKDSDADEEVYYANPIDYGFNFGAAYMIKSFQVSVNYGYGLGNVWNSGAYDFGSISSEQFKAHNRVITLGFSFLFGDD